MREALEDRDLLIGAAQAAGEIALEHFRRGVSVIEKPDGQGPVTAADRAVDAWLRDRLTSARPGYGWLSEETEDSAARLSSERVFIVDPIDGTRAFIAGENGWSVCVAVVEAGRPLAAAVSLPARGEVFAAARDAGATLDGRRIAGSGRVVLEGAETLATRPQLAAEHWPGGAPPVTRAFRPSLAWRLCLVAEGRYDAMLTLRDSWEWDLAAGALIAAEAGLAVTDRDGLPLHFNRPVPKLPGIIAAPPALHGALMARRRPAAPD